VRAQPPWRWKGASIGREGVQRAGPLAQVRGGVNPGRGGGRIVRRVWGWFASGGRGARRAAPRLSCEERLNAQRLRVCKPH
jgi:hypothetical protein